MSNTCGRALIAEEDGAIYSCDHFVDDGHRLGYITPSAGDGVTLADMINSGKQMDFGNAKRDTLTSECMSCPYLVFCGGACPKDRFITEDNPNGQYYLCKGLKMFFAHAVPILEQVMSLSKEGKTPAQIMSLLHS